MLPNHKSFTVEFKSKWDASKDGEFIKETLVAFANTAGGDLYIGVDDDGNVVGLTDSPDVEERLASAVRDNISPSLVGSVVTELLKIQGKVVLRVHVDAGLLKPYCLDPKDASGIYIRRRDTNSLASLDDITRMVRAQNPVPFEERPSFNQDLTFKNCMAFCRQHGVELDLERQNTYGFRNGKQATYTNLAAICSDQSEVRTVIVQFADEEKTEILRSEEITGSVFETCQRAEDFLSQGLGARQEWRSTREMTTAGDYFVDPGAVRDALVMMLIHRDYSLRWANLIDVTPSAIEVYVTGRLLAGDSLESQAEYLSVECRNKGLRHLLEALKLTERFGGGFRRIRKCYQSFPLESLFSVSGDSFFIRLPINQVVRFAEKPRYQTVLNLIADYQEITRQVVQSELGLSQSATINLLRDMVSNDVLEVVGGGRSTKYRVKQ